MVLVPRYTRFASWYDVISAEQVYGVGRVRAIAALHLQEGSRVLDVGCGTGLNFPGLLAAVGPGGQVVGVDRSRQMLEVARLKTASLPPGNVVLVEADAEVLDPLTVGEPHAKFDAVLFTYALSLMPGWEQAFLRATALVRPGGRAAVVDMQPPHGRGRLLTPVARAACWVGGADLEARPWTTLEQTASHVESWSLRSGHVQVRVGTL